MITERLTCYGFNKVPPGPLRKARLEQRLAAPTKNIQLSMLPVVLYFVVLLTSFAARVVGKSATFDSAQNSLRFSHMGPICNTHEYMDCHSTVKQDYFEFCETSNTFCQSYYLDVLLYHCTGYCIHGINLDTWKSIEDICVKSNIVFDQHFQRSRKSWKLFDYGLAERDIEVEGQLNKAEKGRLPLSKTIRVNEATMFLRQGF